MDVKDSNAIARSCHFRNKNFSPENHSDAEM
jgi:hypothetical protein